MDNLITFAPTELITLGAIHKLYVLFNMEVTLRSAYEYKEKDILFVVVGLSSFSFTYKYSLFILFLTIAYLYLCLVGIAGTYPLFQGSSNIETEINRENKYDHNVGDKKRENKI